MGNIYQPVRLIGCRYRGDYLVPVPGEKQHSKNFRLRSDKPDPRKKLGLGSESQKKWKQSACLAIPIILTKHIFFSIENPWIQPEKCHCFFHDHDQSNASPKKVYSDSVIFTDFNIEKQKINLMDRLLSVSDPSSFVSAETGSVVEPVQS